MKRISKVHWRWFKTFHEAWKLNPDDGILYSGVDNEDPDVIQIAEAENGHLQIWKFLEEEKYFWIVRVRHAQRFGFADTKHHAGTRASLEYKRLCLACS